MSNEVTLRFSDTTVTLKSVGGSSASDVTSAITTHNADTTAVHGIADTAALDTVAARNAAILAGAPGGATVSDQVLKAWAESGAYERTSTIYNVTYPTIIASAIVKWPDGSAGALTVTAQDTTFLVETAYTITHTDSGKTVTQSAVTLDANGNITTKPALTVA